ncbi:MAG: nicotinamide-nucleotide amidohydrolase family protein [Chlamydiota bacterium]
MIIELVSIGDELLKGVTLNSNVAYIARKLQESGYDVARQLTLPDEKNAMAEGLREVLNRADLVISTGGLGPTLDDQTRAVAAELFGSDFRFDEQVAKELHRRFGDALSSLKDQATVPTKARVLLNSVGTAPGLIFAENGKTLILLPGVPLEMHSMFSEQVIPYLEKTAPSNSRKQVSELHFSILIENAVDPHLRKLCTLFPAVEAGIYPAWGTLSVVLRSVDAAQLKSFENELQKLFGAYAYVSSSGKIEEAVHAWFLENGKTLAFAESCTGGTMASHITALADASRYFLGSLVTYSNAMKERILGVSPETLKTQGAVSEETVREMLSGVFKQTDADYAIAVSGIAGPSGGSAQKPVGTIWAAIGERGKDPDVGTFIAKGNRQSIILSTTNQLLGALYRKVTLGINAFPIR